MAFALSQTLFEMT